MKKIFVACLIMTNCYSATCESPPLNYLTVKAKKTLHNQIYLTLATVTPQHLPWNTPVYTAFNQQYQFFWMSRKLAQHSKNLQINHQVFAVAYDSTLPHGEGFGVYLQGRGRVLNDNIEIRRAIKIMGRRLGKTRFPNPANFQRSNARRVYEFTPQHVWVNYVKNMHGQMLDGRVEITKCLRP